MRESGEEIFVHQRSVVPQAEGQRGSLRDGQAVAFVVVEHDKGVQADRVTVLENPSMRIRSLLSQRIEAAFTALGLSGQALLQSASRPEYGDYQANGVMAAAKRAGQNPREVAQAIIDAIDLDGIASDLSVAGPGFINITLAPEFIANAVTSPQPSVDPQRVVVDYSGPNLAKRKCTLGICAARLSVTALRRCWKVWGIPSFDKITSVTGVRNSACC